MASGSPGRAVLALVKVALTVINAARALVTAFTGEWDDVVFKVQDLGGHYRQAESYLCTLRNHSPKYPNYRQLESTLQEYEAFLDEYKPILMMGIDQSQRRWQILGKQTSSLEGSKNTAQWVLSVQRAVELKQSIIACTEEINKCENSISNDQLQVHIRAMEANISSRLRDLEESIMTEIRASTPLPMRTQPTPSPDKGLSGPLSSRSFSKSNESPRPAPLSTPPFEARSAIYHSRRYSSISSIDLGPPTEFQSYPAQISIRKSKPRIEQENVELSYGDMIWAGHHERVIACVNTKTGFTVDHKCLDPCESVFPHTLHSNIAEPYEVNFLKEFSLEIREPGKKPQVVLDDPRYLFEREEDCARFQSWLHRKKSMRTFEIETVKAASEKLADDIGLKIWQDDIDGPSLSLFANKLTHTQRADMNFEFPISLFKYDENIISRTEKVKLEFDIIKKESIPNLWQFGRRKSSKDMESERGSARHSSTTSIASFESMVSNASIYSNAVLRIDPDDLIKRLRHLKIQFKSPEECTTFTEAFLLAQKSTPQVTSCFPSPDLQSFPSGPQPSSWGSEMEESFKIAANRATSTSDSSRLSLGEGPSTLPSPYLPAQAQPLGEGAAFYRAACEEGRESPSPTRSLKPSDLIFHS